MTGTHANGIGFGWIVAAVLVLSLTAVGPTAVHAESGHQGGGHGGGHSGGHHGGGHGLHLSYGHHGGSHASYGYSGYSGYSGYGHRGYGYGHSSYGRGYGYGSGYRYSNSYYRYPPIHNRYDSSYGYGGYPSYSYSRRPRVTVYYGGTHDLAPRPYGEYLRQASASTTRGVTAYDRSASVGARGWAMLADGRHHDALGYFASEAPARPGDGLPKIGYALSAALGGDLDIGVWAMRRAVGVDIGALHRVRESGEAAAAIDRAVVLYESDHDTDRPDADKAFMLAVLYDLRGEVDASRAKIAEAIDAGDSSASAAALRQMLDNDYPEATNNDSGSDGY